MLAIRSMSRPPRFMRLSPRHSARCAVTEWVSEIGKGLTEVTVRVRQPEVTHTVRIKDFESWLNRRGRTPAEIVLKSRLRQMLGMPPA